MRDISCWHFLRVRGTRAAPVNAFKGGFALMAKKIRCGGAGAYSSKPTAHFLVQGWPLLKNRTSR